MADPTEETWVTVGDMLTACACCQDYGCTCDLVFGEESSTDEQQWALWLWLVSDAEKGQA